MGVAGCCARGVHTSAISRRHSTLPRSLSHCCGVLFLCSRLTGALSTTWSSREGKIASTRWGGGPRTRGEWGKGSGVLRDRMGGAGEGLVVRRGVYKVLATCYQGLLSQLIGHAPPFLLTDSACHARSIPLIEHVPPYPPAPPAPPPLRCGTATAASYSRAHR